MDVEELEILVKQLVTNVSKGLEQRDLEKTRSAIFELLPYITGASHLADEVIQILHMVNEPEIAERYARLVEEDRKANPEE